MNLDFQNLVTGKKLFHCIKKLQMQLSMDINAVDIDTIRT